MLPTTTRKTLRIPHHVAIVCAGLCMAMAFYVDIQHASVDLADTGQTQERSTVQAKAPQKRVAPHLLPRLLPWTPTKPRN